MCDYSLHAVKTRPAQVGETVITTTFRGTSTRGFASEREPAVAVCMLPGTELAFAEDVRYDNRWIWTRTTDWRVGKFNQIEPEVSDRHHDAIEFPDGSHVLVTQLCEGQRATVLQLPVTEANVPPRRRKRRQPIHRHRLNPSALRSAGSGPADHGDMIFQRTRRRGAVGGQQGYMAKGRTRHGARTVHVPVRLAHRHGRRSRDLAAIPRGVVHAGQPAVDPNAPEEFHLGAFEIPAHPSNPSLDEH